MLPVFASPARLSPQDTRTVRTKDPSRWQTIQLCTILARATVPHLRRLPFISLRNPPTQRVPSQLAPCTVETTSRCRRGDGGQRLSAGNCCSQHVSVDLSPGHVLPGWSDARFAKSRDFPRACIYVCFMLQIGTLQMNGCASTTNFSTPSTARRFNHESRVLDPPVHVPQSHYLSTKHRRGGLPNRHPTSIAAHRDMHVV